MSHPQAVTAPSDESADAEVEVAVEPDSDNDVDGTVTETPAPEATRRHLVVYLLIPLLVLSMTVGAGYLKFRQSSMLNAQAAAASSVQAATDGTIALLSYRPDTAQETLTAARDRLTGSFRDSYTSLTNDVVIPGSTQKRISATATVPAAASVSATASRAVVLVFVDQSVIVGEGAPSATASAVQVTLDKVGNQWLISGFDPK
ncbi:hypothetical protein [Mycobacterium sp. AT1]|uniref:hypothetical protein n=1 Tax=Mycobacterium sp. AT1 TaxID=1961706 RepID=UPI0009AD71F1|nr:hypothetical protein [Mycobacterium sp. AT1]OPX12343.1 hypothetical protein B1790_04030 [Mycobacterium sp. AT1]